MPKPRTEELCTAALRTLPLSSRRRSRRDTTWPAHRSALTTSSTRCEGFFFFFRTINISIGIGLFVSALIFIYWWDQPRPLRPFRFALVQLLSSIHVASSFGRNFSRVDSLFRVPLVHRAALTFIVALVKSLLALLSLVPSPSPSPSLLASRRCQSAYCVCLFYLRAYEQ